MRTGIKYRREGSDTADQTVGADTLGIRVPFHSHQYIVEERFGEPIVVIQIHLREKSLCPAVDLRFALSLRAGSILMLNSGNAE